MSIDSGEWISYNQILFVISPWEAAAQLKLMDECEWNPLYYISFNKWLKFHEHITHVEALFYFTFSSHFILVGMKWHEKEWKTKNNPCITEYSWKITICIMQSFVPAIIWNELMNVFVCVNIFVLWRRYKSMIRGKQDFSCIFH